MPVVVNGACGSDDGKTLASTPTNLCNTGTSNYLSGLGPWSWQCTGQNGGTNASCYASSTTQSSSGGGECIRYVQTACWVDGRYFDSDPTGNHNGYVIQCGFPTG